MSKVYKLGAALTVLLGLLGGSAQAGIDDGRYANQTPYVDPASTPPVLTPPDGYEMLFIETVGRHGSRSMTSTSVETRVLRVWKAAKRKGKLTSAGKKFASDLTKFQSAERRVGYGKLTRLGKAEWTGIGRRTAENYDEFFSGLTPSERIAMVTSTLTRTKQSAASMTQGIDLEVPDLTYAPTTTNEALLELPIGSTSSGRAAITKIKKSYAVRLAAKHVLRTMYTKSYVDSLDAPVSAALDIYVLYSTGPAMADHTSVTFGRYVPLRDALVLGYVKDAEKFYEFGPGVAGQTNSYIKALPLLDDFFERLDDRIDGGSTAAVFRHGHGETTVPFAALIKAPDSEVQAPADGVYTRSNNPWRGAVAGVPAGSIEWVAYKNAEGHVLVAMRYNERPVDFKEGCDAAPGTPHFYEVKELKICLY